MLRELFPAELAEVMRFVDKVRFPDVPKALLDRALLAAEERGLLRLVAAGFPAPFVEPSAGIPTARGLLYFIAPGR